MLGSRLPSRALIADDDEFFRIALVAILTRTLGFTEVIETKSFDEALARIGETENDPVSLALFDLEMPGMAGAVSIGAVRECFPNLRVAIVSASTRRRDILLALEMGAHGYVPKGSGAAELAKALKMIIDGIIFVPPCLAEAPPAGQPSMLIPEERGATPRVANGQAHLDSGATGLVEGLTRRQRDVLRLIVDGKANKEIARALALSEGTVKVHVAALLRALGVSNRAGAAASGARFLER